MHRRTLLTIISTTIITLVINNMFAQDHSRIRLPEPRMDSDFSIEKAMLERRSVREYSDEALTLDQVAQLLWACQGVTSDRGFRTAPSAGALYPLEVFAFVSNVDGLEPGIYRYVQGTGIGEHYLDRLREGDSKIELANAALGQDCIKDAALIIVIGAVVQRTALKYGDRADKYVLIEVGHAAQNICLQAQALELGVVTVGAMYDEKVKQVIGSEADPKYILCVGRK